MCWSRTEQTPDIYCDEHRGKEDDKLAKINRGKNYPETYKTTRSSPGDIQRLSV